MCLTEVNSAGEATHISRRRFLTAAGASAATLAMMPSGLAAESAAKEKINLGLIGCGTRGEWIADLFRKHGGYNFVALADYFPEKADAAGQAAGVPPERRFTGLSGYKRLLEQKLDAVAIECPANVHPEHAAAAVAAGKHVCHSGQLRQSDGRAQRVRSTLATILGRMAVYRKGNVTWEEMMRHPEPLVADLEGLKV